MSRALTHIALNVRDRAASEAFYRDWAGMVNSTPDQNHQAPWLSTPGQEGRFALVLVPGAPGPHRQDEGDETHIGIIMESEAALDALYERAQHEGIVHTGLHEGVMSGRKAFSVSDPDGNVVQFTFKRHALAPLTRSFNSMTLHVHDLQASEEFFTKWGGMKLLGHPHEGEMARLASPGYENTFNLILRGDAQTEYLRDEDDISHLGFAVSDRQELVDVFNAAAEAKLKYWNLQTHAYPVGTLFSVKDPDGHIVEFSIDQPLGDLSGGPQP
ncbi:MAG TPA: VOC family protein [Patescibacteria group bacterium]|nr:VOC family protein [Patescibacteria group bacterium]